MKPIAFAAVLALGACTSAIDRQLPQTEPRFAFGWERTSREWYQQIPSATVRAEGGTVRVDGQLTSPHACIDVQAEGRARGSRLEVHVSVKPDMAALCVGRTQNVVYTASFAGLPAGTYPVRITHAFGAAAWPGGGTVEAEVTVR